MPFVARRAVEAAISGTVLEFGPDLPRKQALSVFGKRHYRRAVDDQAPSSLSRRIDLQDDAELPQCSLESGNASLGQFGSLSQADDVGNVFGARCRPPSCPAP